MSSPESSLKVCPESQCKYAGQPQAISNFRIKSRSKTDKNTVYRSKFCRDCEKHQRRKRQSPKKELKQASQVIADNNKETKHAHSKPSKNSTLGDENILEEYNRRNPGQKLTSKEFESALKAFQMLSQWKRELLQHIPPSGYSRTREMN